MKVQVIKITDSYLSPFEVLRHHFYKRNGIVEIMDRLIMQNLTLVKNNKKNNDLKSFLKKIE